MENGEKFGTISINLEMVLKKSETFNKFKGNYIRDKTKMHPPPRKPKGKNSSKIVSIIRNKPGMVKIGSLVEEKFGPSINVIIIIVRRITIIKNSGRGRVITPIFLRKYFVNISIMENYFLGNRSLAINWFEMKRFGLLQNIGIISKVFLGMFRNPMEILGKIREG
jgi:hypothetical protein